MDRGERRLHLNSTNVKKVQLPSDSSSTSAVRVRSLSLSLSNAHLSSPSSSVIASTPKTPPTSPFQHYSGVDWECESIASNFSVSSCDHATVARNGTTFSGRTNKYVLHCTQHAGEGEEYLTPTQRVHRQVKRLKYLLQQAKKDLEEKDSDILRLTKEVVELRLFKAALNSPEDKSSSSSSDNNTVTVRESILDAKENEMSSSCTDSGHYEESPLHGKSAICMSKIVVDKSVNTCLDGNMEHTKLIHEYEIRMQELVKTYEEDTYQIKQKHNDKVEDLLQKITEINSRYWTLVPELECAKEKIKELELQLEDACTKLKQAEEKRSETSQQLKETIDKPNDFVSNATFERISVPELLQELQVTKNELENIKAMYRQLTEAKNKNKIDPEITIQFLKSAVYYFLTDKENSQGHLRAIQSILGFTPHEISIIEKNRII